MPGWLQPVAENQPVTAMVGAVRALVLGGDTEPLLGHTTTWFVVRSIAVVGRHPGAVRHAVDPQVHEAVTGALTSSISR